MLTLKKDGILERKKWSDGEYHFDDVTDVGFKFLDERIYINEDVTLRDFFLFLQHNLDTYDLIFGNWLEEHTDAALNRVQEDEDPEDKESELEYLEIYWQFNIDEDGFGSLDFPSFHGVSFAKKDSEYDHYKVGEKVKWAIEFSPIQNLVHLPLRLCPELEIYNELTKETNTYPTQSYTLYQLIQGIIWEISFLGGPDSVISRRDDLDALQKKIEDGTEELIPMDNFLDSLKDKISSDEV